MSGYIKLSRKYFNNFLWNEKRKFSKAEAWLDLIQLVRYDATNNGKKLVNGKLIEWKRGEFPASSRYLNERWNWSGPSQVKRFLDLLKNEDMIATRVEQGETVITLCNYDSYNTDWNDVGTVVRTVVEHQQNGDKTVAEQQQNETVIQSKKDNTVKKDEKGNIPSDDGFNPHAEKILKEEYRKEFLKVMKFIFEQPILQKIPKTLTVDEYEKLREKYTFEQIEEMMIAMANHKATNKSQTIYLTLLTYLKKNFSQGEVKELEPIFEKMYRDFIVKQEPDIHTVKLTDFDRRSMRTIIGYLLENNVNANKKRNDNKDTSITEFTDKDGAVISWRYILTNWNKLDNFMQKRVKLTEIDNDLMKILTDLKNAKLKAPADGNKDNSQRKEFN